MTKTIPTPEAVHPSFAQLLARNLELNEIITSLRREAADIRLQLADGDAVSREDRIAAIADGRPISQPVPVNDKLRTVLSDLRDAEDALVIVTHKMREERQTASRIISEMVLPEHREHLASLWKGIAAALQVCLTMHDLHRELRRSGVEPLGLAIPDASIFHEPTNRASGAAIGLRRAASDGLIPAKLIPESLR